MLVSPLLGYCQNLGEVQITVLPDHLTTGIYWGSRKYIANTGKFQKSKVSLVDENKRNYFNNSVINVFLKKDKTLFYSEFELNWEFQSRKKNMK